MCFDLSQGSHRMAFDCFYEMLVNQSRRHDTRGVYVCRKHNFLMRYFLSNILFGSCHSFGILALVNDLYMETFMLSLFHP